MAAAILTPKDNVVIWAGIFLPRLMCSSIIFMLCFSPLEHTSYSGPSFYTSLAHFLVNMASLLFWADWRCMGKLCRFSYKLEHVNKAITAASLISMAVLLLEVARPRVVCSQLCVLMLLVTFAWEILHVHAVPADMKFSQNSKISQSFYILGVFISDFIFICFLAHIFTKGVLIPWQKFYYKLN